MADPAQQSRQPSNAYPSPHSYPSPSMQPAAYNYPQANAEPYRGSPQQGNNMSLPPLNLPPIRGLQDGQAQPQQPPPGQPTMGSPLPPPQHGMPPQYYAHAGHPPPGQPMAMGSAPHMMRYQLPPQADQRILSGGRHKKEIKRRTKTGCLTCRKRRIKCDEAHPVCRNCQKSKRECLGYDPIFKQQPGPPQIQPAPNSAPPQNTAPAPAPPTTAAPYASQVPQGYAPAVSAGYAPPAPATGAGHPSHENYNGPAIDPALAAADPAMQGGQAAYNGAHALNPVLRGMENTHAYPPHDGPIRAKRLNISDIFPIGNHQPPEIPVRAGPVPSELDDEFSKIFANDYCLGLDAVLETQWYSTHNNAINRIFADKALHDEAIHFVETVKYRTNNADMGGIFSQEARLIWHMLGVCKRAPPFTNGTNGASSMGGDGDGQLAREVQARFDILEALLTNQTLQSNPMHYVSYPAELPPHKRAQLDFWVELGNFVVHADNDAAPPGAVDNALTTMRNVLDQQETRDTLYSIAIARYIGNRFRGFPNALAPAPPGPDSNPENDLNKLHVAMSFISYEARSGSQQVTARICDMAMLSWTVSRS